MTNQTIICPLSGTTISVKDSLLSRYILEQEHPLYRPEARSKLDKAINRNKNDVSLLAGAIISLIQEKGLCSKVGIAPESLAQINRKLQKYPAPLLQFYYQALPLINQYARDLPKISFDECLNGTSALTSWIKLCLAEGRITVDMDNKIAAALPDDTFLEVISTIKQIGNDLDFCDKHRKVTKKERKAEQLAKNKLVPKIVRTIRINASTKLMQNLANKDTIKALCLALDHYDKGILLDQEVQDRLANKLHQILKAISNQISEQAYIAFDLTIKDLRLKALSEQTIGF